MNKTYISWYRTRLSELNYNLRKIKRKENFKTAHNRQVVHTRG